MEVEILILITAELRDNNSKLQDNKQYGQDAMVIMLVT